MEAELHAGGRSGGRESRSHGNKGHVASLGSPGAVAVVPSVVRGSVDVRTPSPKLRGGCRKGIVFLSLVQNSFEAAGTTGRGQAGRETQ